MNALDKLKWMFAKTLGKSKSDETDEDEVFVTGDEEATEREEKEGRYEVPVREGKYEPEQIILTFRAKPGEEAINIDHDFSYIPTQDEIAEEFGPGIYNVFVREEEGKRPKLKKRYRIEGHPILPVVKYEVKVRVHEGGDLLDTKVEFPGPRPPEKEEIINALGGGGFIKLNARDKDNRIIWSEWYDFRDVEPPKSLVARDGSIKSKIEQEVEARKKKVEDEILRHISEREDEKKSKFDETVDKLIETLEDRKLEKLQEAIEAFGEKLGGSSALGEKHESVGLSDLALKEPYRLKLEAQRTAILQLAKTDPEEALNAINNIPDGISIGLQFGLAITGLIEAITDYLKEVSSKERKKGIERERRREKRKARKEEEGEKEKSLREEEVQAKETVEEEEPKISVEEIGDESGIEFIFSQQEVGDEMAEEERE